MADTVYLVDNGLKAIVDELVTLTKYKYVAWGTGTTAATTTNTAMETIAAPTTTTAVTGTVSAITTNTTNDTYQVVATITAGGTLSIAEVGIFNQATVSGATMFLRGTFTAISLSSGDSIEFTLKSVFNQV